MFISILVASAVLAQVSATPAPVSSAEVSGAPAGPVMTYAPPKAADQKDNQLVCKSEAVLGSRLPVRRCRTVADIKDRMLQDQQAVDRAQANLQIKSN